MMYTRAGVILCAILGPFPVRWVEASPPSPNLSIFATSLGTRLTPDRAVTYRRIGTRELRLFIFAPRGTAKRTRVPVFITYHGGGWRGGAPVMMYAFAEHYARLGMMGISVEYRLCDPEAGVLVEDCVRDARAAVRFVRARAKEWEIDPHRIVANGSSAGAHLAAGTALFDGFDAPDDDLAVSCRPDALVLFSPVIDASAQGYGHGLLGPNWHKLSPLHCVRQATPPTLLFQGTADTTTPYSGAVAFATRMKLAGNDCQFITTEGGDHAYMVKDPDLYRTTLQQTDEFLRQRGFIDQPPVATQP